MKIKPDRDRVESGSARIRAATRGAQLDHVDLDSLQCAHDVTPIPVRIAQLGVRREPHHDLGIGRTAERFCGPALCQVIRHREEQTVDTEETRLERAALRWRSPLG